MEQTLFFLLVHIVIDLYNLRDAASEVHSSINTDSSLNCCIRSIKLGIRLLQQRSPELVGRVGPEINQLPISSGK